MTKKRVNIPMYLDTPRPPHIGRVDVREHWSGALKVVALLGIFALAIYYNHELTYAAFGIAALLLGIKVTGWLQRPEGGNKK